MPRRRTTGTEGRDVPLRSTVLDAPTRARYAFGLSLLMKWLGEVSSRPQLEDLGESSTRNVNFYLEQFVECLHARGDSVSRAVDAVLGFVSRFYWHRPTMEPTWRLVSAWKMRQPLECRHPIPPVVLRAVIAVALAWSLPRLGVMLWVAFYTLLRPESLVSG
jgi:hypothetical protein